MSNGRTKHSTKESIFYGMVAILLIGAFCVRAASDGSIKTIESIKPPFVFSIKTLTPDDKPLAGVKVKCVHPRTQQGRAIVDMVVDSNEQGVAVFNVTEADIAQDRYFWFSLAEGNFIGNPHVGISPVNNEYTYTFRVMPAEQFQFLVLDEHGKPVPDAKLWLFSDHPAFPRLERGVFRAVTSATTDDKGIAEVTYAQVPTNIVTSAEGRASSFIRGASLPKDKPYTIRLSPGCTISGRVVDSESKPVENAKLTATNKDLIIYYMSQFKLEATSDANGGFVLENAQEGTYEIQALMQPPYETMYAKPVSVKIEDNNSVSGVEILAQGGASLKGRYVTSHNLKVADRTIYVYASSPVRKNWEVKTKNDGSFVISGLPQNGRGIIEFATVAGYHASVTMSGAYPFFRIESNRIIFDTLPHGTFEGVQVEFLLKGRAAGRVFDSSGETMPGKLLVVRPGGRTYRTNDKGEYTAEIPPNERVTLEVVDEASGTIIVKCEPFMIQEGQVIEKDLKVGEESSKLVGQPFPAFEGIDIDFYTQQAAGRMILVCFWDMQQRPSRNCITQLAGLAGKLSRQGVTVIAVHASKVDKNTLDEWMKKSNIDFPVGIIEADEEETRFMWGVKSLPWLILTNSEHVVTAVDFNLDELNELITGAEGEKQ